MQRNKVKVGLECREQRRKGTRKGSGKKRRREKRGVSRVK